MRSLLALALVLGGLGLLLIYVKRRNSIGGQARKVNGSSWFSNLLPQNRKQKPIMEVVATHVLGPKQSIVVMKIRGQQFVLAVTAENIQLITQLDAEESELDLLDDPKVAASIGKMFGVNKEPAIEPVVAAPAVATDASFNSLLKNSTGAGAIIARNAYAAGGAATPVPTKTNIAISARDQIRKRLESLQ
jgi:flagellar biogenesis protein FliO